MHPSEKWGSEIIERSSALTDSLKETVNGCHDLNEIISLFADWMQRKADVHVLGAGRSRLAAAIPANRLAHGGAEIHIHGGIIDPPPISENCGILAVSASGKTKSVIDPLRKLKSQSIQKAIVLGIGDANAIEFKNLCDYYISIRLTPKAKKNTLRAQADIHELISTQILDAITVAAGKSLGYDEQTWRRGHEDIDSGPYYE